MSSFPVRDQTRDELLTPKNSALIARMTQPGVRPISWVQLICELQRDWNRLETVPTFSKVLFAVEGH
jgi:hypothetical protein